MASVRTGQSLRACATGTIGQLSRGDGVSDRGTGVCRGGVDGQSLLIALQPPSPTTNTASNRHSVPCVTFRWFSEEATHQVHTQCRPASCQTVPANDQYGHAQTTGLGGRGGTRIRCRRWMCAAISRRLLDRTGLDPPVEKRDFRPPAPPPVLGTSRRNCDNGKCTRRNCPRAR